MYYQVSSKLLFLMLPFSAYDPKSEFKSSFDLFNPSVSTYALCGGKKQTLS